LISRCKVAEKDVYGELLRADLRKAPNIPTNRDHAIISVGTFAIGHIGMDAFRELNPTSPVMRKVFEIP
jgi:hypothetical protein